MEADWPEDLLSFGCAAQDIEQSNCYLVLDEDNPVAAFTLTSASDTTDDLMHINWNSNMEHYVIQRISSVAGSAVARTIFDYAASRAEYLRCFTHERNTCLRHALEVFGFKECGTFIAEDGSTRIAYDWIKAPDPQD